MTLRHRTWSTDALAVFNFSFKKEKNHVMQWKSMLSVFLSLGNHSLLLNMAPYRQTTQNCGCESCWSKQRLRRFRLTAMLIWGAQTVLHQVSVGEQFTTLTNQTSGLKDDSFPGYTDFLSRDEKFVLQWHYMVQPKWGWVHFWAWFPSRILLHVVWWRFLFATVTTALHGRHL